MPYEKEHVAVIRRKGDFKLFRRKTDEFGSGIDVIYGQLKRTEMWEIHSIHFNSDNFTTREAQKWLRDHGFKYIKFEPATGE